MGIFTLLGFGTNWNRVNKRQLAESLYNVGIVVQHLTHLEKYNYSMERFFEVDELRVKKDWVYKIIISFGRYCPTKTEYDKFKEFVSTSDLLPSERQLRKYPELQENWDIAYRWALEYEKTRAETIIANKEKKNKELEKQIKEMERMIANYEKSLSLVETQNSHSLLLKEQKIAELQQNLAKKQLKINTLKRKKYFKLFKKEQKEISEND